MFISLGFWGYVLKGRNSYLQAYAEKRIKLRGLGPCSSERPVGYPATQSKAYLVFLGK